MEVLLLLMVALCFDAFGPIDDPVAEFGPSDCNLHPFIVDPWR